jgi:transposase
VDAAVDFSLVEEEVRETYCEENGRPGIPPETALRLMLAGFLLGIVKDRKLLRRAQTDLAIRWFAGYRLDEVLPDHSSLTRIRQRWGKERFKGILKRVVKACVEAGLVGGKTMHVDATLIRADVSWESLTTEHVVRVVQANEGEEQEPESPKPKGRPRGKKKPKKKRSTTDPDATMATSRKDQRLEPTFKQHTAVDDQEGIVVDVEVTTGEQSEGKELQEQLERVEEATGIGVETLTADAAYAHGANYAALEDQGIEAVIPPQRERCKAKRIPVRRFKYDGKHQRVTCPAGKVLHRSTRVKNGIVYRAAACDCAQCPLRKRCLSEKASSRTVLIVDGYEALLRARRKRRGWDNATWAKYTRHRWRVEGAHGEAKVEHGLRRAVRRGLDNVAIQAYLTAVAMNLKRLAKAFLRLLCLLRPSQGFWSRPGREIRPYGTLWQKTALGFAASHMNQQRAA